MTFWTPIQRHIRLAACAFWLALPGLAISQIAVVVPAEALSRAMSQCSSELACRMAIAALVERLLLENPGVAAADILGSVTAAVSAAYNRGELPPAETLTLLSSLAALAAEQDATPLLTGIDMAQAAVLTGAPIGLEPVAIGEASPN